jgi:hypothetical protein
MNYPNMSNEEIKKKFENELKEMLAGKVSGFNWLGSPYSSIKKVMPSRSIKVKHLQEVILKPDWWVKAGYFFYFLWITFLPLIPIIMDFFWIHYIFIFPIYLYAIHIIIKRVNKKITINYSGILFKDDFTPWGEILECYITTYSKGRGYSHILYILLNSGAYKEYNIGAINQNKLSHYIYMFKQIGNSLVR